ncbi:MAG: tyrosine-protein phosphatase [Xenococcaceae cyanobacterium]
MKQPENFREPQTRHLQLAGCLNLRDLGGYATSDDKFTSWRTLLRGDSLHRLSPENQQAIIEYGVKTIIDLRTLSEVNREPYVLSKSPEISYFNLPLIEEEDFPQLMAKKSLLEHNYFSLEKRSPKIKEILEIIATKQTAVVIHCAAGKDRTGIIIALLLAIAQVPVKTIAQDYQLSDRYLTSFYANIQEEAIKKGFAHMLLSPAEVIMDTFSYLDEHYGGVNGYLQTIGINQEQIKRLQTILVN